MKKEDWIRKLTSRKFWLAVAGLVTGIVSFLKQPTTDAETISALILSLGSVVAYLVAEGMVDAAREGGDTYSEGDTYTEAEWPEEKPPEE